MKPEIVFGLENAAWPALLLNVGCVVLRANKAATSTFGAALSGDSPKLSAVWLAENGGAPDEFLARWEQTPVAVANLKLRTANGLKMDFTAAVCTFSREGYKWFVLQLLPVIAPPPPPPPPPPPVPVVQPFGSMSPTPAAPGAASPPGDAKGGAPDSGLMLKQKLDCALQLARTVSLDFNNALTSILGHASFLLSKAEAGHPWRHSLMEVEKSAGRAAEISNELAIFSRQEKETRRVPPGNLNVVANRCVDFFRNAQGSKITWKTQLEKDLFASRFDEANIQQAMTKVLENAAEAVPSGSGQITVQSRNVELAEPTQDHNVRLAAGTYVCIEITDNGVGIDPTVLPRIFEPFFTTKDKSHRGLGLALAYGILTNHGGGVAVSSQPGAGTSARIYLPAERHIIREIVGGDENFHGTETILIVDDESLLLTMGETILTEYGYRVLTANSGQKALTILSRDDTKVDLLITDLVMPAMGGRELIEKARALVPTTRILCTSGCVLPTERQADTAYLQKPFTSRELLLKVKQTLTEPGRVAF